MRNEKGITLLTLGITIILLLIIATLGITYSNSSQQSAKLTKYKTEIEIIQAKVETIKDDEEFNQVLENYGLTDESTIKKCNEILKSELTENFENISNIEEYQKQFIYYSKNQIENNLNISGIEQDYLINIQDNIVISVKPLKYQNKEYYSIQGLEKDGLASILYKPSR